jgi:RND family efflux transporter MFP subunit
MRAEVQGAVLDMVVEQGQKVKKGQLLARIEDNSVQDQLLAARTAVRVARNGLQVARAEEARNRKLADAGIITRRDLEQAQLARAQAQAQLSEAEARLALARQQMGRTRLRAPFAGVVSERHASAGDIVQPGTALYTVIDPTSLRLEASVPAAQLSTLQPGVGVDFNVGGYGDRSFQGRIERINPAVDPATGQVRLYVTLPNTEQALLTGLFAEGRVAALQREAPAVPVSAVDLRAEPPTVLRVQDGKLARVPVTLGMKDEVARLVELRSGVKAGDILVRSPAQDLTEGTRVEVRTPEKPREPEPGVGGAGTPPEAAEPR